ncbi:hypothetical protein EDC39_102226 [Geothermobacter ehrlichii]|uniref:Uncharacterized protein n=1 Tax=Geothermobacter ehrlichii TaxID=213224 RepID=A0A5D3WQE3_9BACT|nr:hypothetical protein [Geothermobacter ehrlichii]TYO99700.1 hypothetical protein EDC39_102226 [Geothermobacter ehrlichii]
MQRDNNDNLFEPGNFDIGTLEDEIRADQLVGELLRQFCHELVERQGEEPATAGRMARGADLFLRDFIIGDRRENIFRIDPPRVRQFAGNWYIVKTLEPNMAELGDILEGVAAFYAWLQEQGHYPHEQGRKILRYCTDLDYYRQRIDQFWQLEDDGYRIWNSACPIEP